jgi:diguanylate cyclase (GGDEF)-like protein/PAS domain S-box-containing protein
VRIEDGIASISAICDDLAMVTEVMPDGGLRIHWVNPALCAATGYSEEELVGRHPDVFGGPSPDPDVLSWLNDARASVQRFRGTLPYYRKDGSHFWGDLQLSPWFDAKGRCTHWVSILRDITPDMELRDAFTEAKQAAVTAQERLWSAIEALPDAFVMFDADDRLVMCNARYRELYPETAHIIRPGVTFEEVLRAGLARGQYLDAVGREEEWLRDRIERHRNPEGPVEHELPGGRFVRVHEAKMATGEIVGFRVDVTELKRQQRAVERHARALAVAMERAEVTARTDTLTGLANRRGLDLHLRALSTRGAGEDTGAAPVAFLHIDLDRFKQINDMLGHAAGDHVLREVAHILRRAVRPGDHVARVGGDEFAIVIEAEDAEAAAWDVAERVIVACREPIWFEGRACHYGASIGIAVAGDGVARSSLMEDADIALYEAKENGRNRAALYMPALRDAAEDRKRVADDLRLALERDEFEPWFQPQLDVSSRRLVGVEALARWRHPMRGILLPEVFLPIAEELDVADEIDRRIFHGALAAIRKLHARGGAIPKVSFNVSSQRLARVGLGEAVRSEAPLPCRVAVELLEIVGRDEEGEHVRVLVDDLRAKGIGIEIDDFGSGNASLTTLLHLRPERIKLAHQLVAAATSSGPGATRLLGAIGDMAEALCIGMTAKGVESAEEAAKMAEIGCSVIQGRLVAMPMPIDALETWLSAQAGEAGAPARAAATG